MAPITVTFLGTSAGSGPSVTRNTSSIFLNVNSKTCLVDCAEGTQKQLIQAHGAGLKGVMRLEKMYITHLHLDHTAGIAPLLGNLMSAVAKAPDEPYQQPRIQFFAPRGLRLSLRTILTLSYTVLSGQYTVHELLLPSETPSASCAPEELHPNEAPGKDIFADADGLWREFDNFGGMTVSAAHIIHRAPCLGFYFSEPPQPLPMPTTYLSLLSVNAAQLAEQGINNPRTLLGRLSREREPITLPDGNVLEPPVLGIPGRKLLILGDTSDPTECLRLLEDGGSNGVSLLVHECTNAYIPVTVDTTMGGDRTSPEKVREKAISRGHSTPDMAGEFAKRCGARRLIMNHFGTRFHSPGQPPFSSYSAAARSRVITELEDCASAVWGMGRAICAIDFMTVEIHSHELEGPTSPSPNGVDS